MPTRHSTFLIQSSHGTAGNFELVLPRREGGGAVHLWRDNDAATTPWIGPTLAFGSPDDTYAASLIQGNFGVSGNLEVVAVEGSQLVHHYRDDDTNGHWQARTLLPGSLAVTQDVALVQSNHGARGNYEVVAPLAVAGGGGMAHWSRDNDTAGLPWSSPVAFGSGGVDAAAMVQGTLGPLGNLEVFARVAGQIEHYWRDDGATWTWHGPTPIPPAAVGYAETFSVTCAQADSIASAVLMRPSCTTHSFNMEQRLVGLVRVGSAGAELTLQAPPDANIAPPGFYLLFVLDAQGVPSVASFVSLG